ncbi:putative glucan-binding protein D / BglB-like protein [Amycolatopsis camponoti]|uniref:Putative glucan-binding protein D / BglB-like protein n=1 Tax=Amycolatopsis camponoti TaxID=2606593 RepID=A0A6I8LLA8_9PSEU|nr:PHB depolymerase family esterase [Amycolatopsis camponoti]VVJ17673.1 putative glucan-binding protein D / BglB-like protein [Amycolatopsis camponoti]
MDKVLSRRVALVTAAGVTAGLAVPGVAAASSTDASVGFTLDAETLDGGEQVTSLTLDTSRLGPIDPASLTTGTFGVHVEATSPIDTGGQDIGYALDRPVTAARLDRRGNIVLELSHGEGQTGGGTLGYINSKGRNVRLDLVYTLTQNAPVRTRRGRPVSIGRFAQRGLVNPEVDAFTYHASRSGMKYRLYSPTSGHGRRPLIVWLHGGGEGASLPDGYYDNETTLRANRGALGFATREAQGIFDGAYVVAPQSTSAWMDDGPRFAPLIHEIIRDVLRTRPVDPGRVYVAGCSNGGYMSVKMTTVYPATFAASVPICGVVAGRKEGDPPLVPDAELAAIRTPTWLVASLDDDTVDPRANTVHAHELIPRSEVTLYDHVVWNGHQFPGHWSWIYVARNDPSVRGTHVWQWMARKHR